MHPDSNLSLASVGDFLWLAFPIDGADQLLMQTNPQRKTRALDSALEGWVWFMYSVVDVRAQGLCVELELFPY